MSNLGSSGDFVGTLFMRELCNVFTDTFDFRGDPKILGSKTSVGCLTRSSSGFFSSLVRGGTASYPYSFEALTASGGGASTPPLWWGRLYTGGVFVSGWVGGVRGLFCRMVQASVRCICFSGVLG